MNRYEILGSIAAFLTIIGFMWSIKRDIKQQIKKTDSRIDKLYSMFVDLVIKIK